MTPPPVGTSFAGHDRLRDLPLQELLCELDRVERLLTEEPATSSSGSGSLGRLGRDLATDALRARERALEAEIRRRPGGSRRRSLRGVGSGAPPG